jgi:uncharacterized protein YecE (DUF72 family)
MGGMRLYAGTSGFSYKEWKGIFYPEKLPAKGMLAFYAARLPAVEINNTFYRMPRGSLLEGWAGEVPEGFRFSLKASRRITHIKRLKDVEEETAYLIRTCAVLKERLGVLLFQLPPYLKKDAARLDGFLRILPDGTRAAFEFRHESWLDEEIYGLLRERNCAVCVTETGQAPPAGGETPVVSTAGWGYLRLRRESYPETELRSWIARIRAAGWSEAFVFFKHEDEAAGPKMAGELVRLAEGV